MKMQSNYSRLGSLRCNRSGSSCRSQSSNAIMRWLVPGEEHTTELYHVSQIWWFSSLYNMKKKKKKKGRQEERVRQIQKEHSSSVILFLFLSFFHLAGAPLRFLLFRSLCTATHTQPLTCMNFSNLSHSLSRYLSLVLSLTTGSLCFMCVENLFFGLQCFIGNARKRCLRISLA